MFYVWLVSYISVTDEFLEFSKPVYTAIEPQIDFKSG